MPSSDLISTFGQLAEKSYDLGGLWKADAYDQVAALYSGLTDGIAKASAEDRLQLLLELMPRTNSAQGSVSALLCGLAVVKLVCSQEDGWTMRNGQLAVPTEETLKRLSELEQTLSDKSAAGALVAKGFHQFWSGNRVGGFAAFRELSVNADFKYLVRDDLRGAVTCHPDALSETGAAAPEPRGLEIIASCDGSKGAIALTTFDDIYFRAFARRILETANQAGDANLHFHIINPSAQALKLARELVTAGKSRKSSVGISYERQQIKDRATLACARFFVMEPLARHYGQGLLVTDADLFYKRPFGDLLQVVDKSRIALPIQSDPRRGGYLPWRSVSATYLYVPYTEAGVLFSQRVANAIHRAWQEGSNWWIDQTALYCAFNQFGEEFGDTNIVMLPSDIHKALPTSEAYKIQMIGEVPEVHAAMASGMNWNAALQSVQTGPQANTEGAPSLGAKLRTTATRLRKQPPPAPNPPPISQLTAPPAPPPAPPKKPERPPGPMYVYDVTAAEMTPDITKTPDTIIMRKLAHEGADIMRLSGGDPEAPSMGRTGGLSIRVPDEFEATVSAKRVKVEVVARSSTAKPARFSLAYSTAEVGNSGWRAFVASPWFEKHNFEWNVPQMKDGHGDFVGILPHTGNTLDIKSLRVEVVTQE